MDKIRKALLLVLIYLVIFWVGFRSGEIHYRTKKFSASQKISIQDYYIIETFHYGSHTIANFYRANEEDIVIKFLKDENLRPLLKMRDLKIYTPEGKRIY